MLLLQHFTKQCTKCKVLKCFTSFSVDNTKKYNIRSQCKKCNSKGIRSYQCSNATTNSKREYSKRYYNDNKDAIRIANRNYYINNRDVILNKSNEYRKANIEKSINRSRLFYSENTEYCKEKSKIYKKTDKGIAIAKNNNHKRRSKKKQGDVSTKQLLELQQNAKVCYWCNVSFKDKKVHIDHYIPLSKGGEHTLSNLVVSCAKCNMSKKAKMPEEFANELGRLL